MRLEGVSTTAFDSRRPASEIPTRNVDSRTIEPMSDLSLFDITGKSALVTGGAMGLGRACAIALAMGGANVAIVDVNEKMGLNTSAALRALGVEAFFVRCDVSNKEQVEEMTRTVVERFGHLDIGINNAGFGIPPGGSETLVQSEWDRVLGVNLTGVFLCAQTQAQQMIRQSPTEGKIINIASMYGTIAGGNCAYNSAKAGTIQLTRSLASEWGRFNINVNCISPSWTMTPGMINTPPEVRARMREVTPLGHVQRPEDIYGAVLYLASKASNYVTGHNLIVDGGHTLNTWLTPLERCVPPRITPDQETVEAVKDLRSMGISADIDAVPGQRSELRGANEHER
jgi:NAD(P)-dependent dehydrogenase (short-subunit alcohol dehydrogenase family)